MSIINHDLRSYKGCTIYMPEYYEGEEGWGNLALPNVYAADDAGALYPCGTKLVQGNRVFFYGKFLGHLIHATDSSITVENADDMAGRFCYTNAFQQDYANALLVRKQANELSIVYNTTESEARADNFYSGGWVNGKDTAPADERFFWRRIVKHGYQATGSTTEKIWNESTKSFTEVDLSAYTYCSVLELDQPVINTKTSMATTIMPNQWKHIVMHTAAEAIQYSPAMGAMMHNNMIATRFGWFQTWGEMYMSYEQQAFMGAGDEEQMFYIMDDGSCQCIDGATDTYGVGEGHRQVAGVRMGNTAYETGAGVDETLSMVFLMLRR